MVFNAIDSPDSVSSSKQPKYGSACKGQCLKIQHQMEVLNPVYVVPNMTVLSKITILNIHLPCLMKRDGVGGMFPFVNRDISELCLRYEPKND